jgi:hypothetical protein
MGSIDMNLRAGDWVEVKSPVEIAQTLDANGVLDGLPFMPEMVPFCGQRFRVLLRAEKACVEVTVGAPPPAREFIQKDLVVLKGLRCSGKDHDGCQRACVFFWKAAWLRKVESSAAGVAPQAGQDILHAKMKTMVSPGRYFCQSTELTRVTRPLTRPRIVLICIREILSRNRGFFEMTRMILVPLWRRTCARSSRCHLAGSLKRTPIGNLNLQPGEWVEVKSESEIRQTLDEKNRNRGLLFDFTLCKYKGRYRVRNRLDKMIIESTGKMFQLQSTVILEEVNCLCNKVFGGCPRQDPVYWREIWLKRVGD